MSGMEFADRFGRLPTRIRGPKLLIVPLFEPE
jgi:hypothetical protein